MPRFALLAVALLLAALCSTRAVASAQSAKELADRGVAALNEGRFADAVQALDQSYRIQQSPPVLYNLGLAYKGLGHPGKALEAFEGYVKFADPKKDAKTIQAVRAEIDRLKSSYARFALKLTPADATIDIDGVRAIPSNNELWVQNGKHKISVKASGFETYEQELDVSSGRFDLEVRLREPSGPPDQRAAALVDEGMALQAAGSLLPALDKYKQAQQVYPTPRAQAQMGLAEETLGDLGPAETHINEALKARRDPYIKENRKRLQAAANRLKRQVSTLTVIYSPEAEGAEVLVSERSQGKLPLFAPVRVAGGSVTVRAKKAGYRDFEQVLDLPPRGKRTVKVTLEEAPPVVAAPVPVPAPAPAPAPPVEAAVPALTAQPEPPKELPPPEPAKSTQSDIESFSEARNDLQGDPTERNDPATGFEMALNFGYQPFIGGPDLNGSDALLSPQIVLGVRPVWPISVGLQIAGGFDLGTSGTKFVGAAYPGLYVRGHVQQYRKAIWFDVWGGVGLQPLAFHAAALEPQELDPTTIDVNSLDESARDDLARQMAGVDLVHTVQSINVPLELGGTFYVTKGVGIDLAMALTFWIPQQDCLHDGTDRLCLTENLEGKTSFFIGGGLAFLP